MIKGFTQNCHTEKDKCLVCGERLLPQDMLVMQQDDTPVCRAIDCRNIMSRKDAMPELAFESYLELNQKLVRHRRQVGHARKRFIASIQEQEQQENHQICEHVLKQYPEIDENNLQLVSIPSGNSQVEPVPQERVDNYLGHLRKIIHKAAKLKHVSEAVQDEHYTAHEKLVQIEQRLDDITGLRQVSEQLCFNCKGGCCVTGANHAYLSICSIKRYMDRHPEMSAEDIFEQYVSMLPEASIQHSCINQTSQGCVLPRELRSDICNGHFCEPVKQLQLELENEGRLGSLLAIQRSYNVRNKFETGVNNEIVAVFLYDSDQQHEIDLEELLTESVE